MNVREMQRRAALGLSVDYNDISKLCSAYLALLSKYDILLRTARRVQALINRVAENSDPTYLLNRVLRDLENESCTECTAKPGTSTGTCADGSQSHEIGSARRVKPISEL